MAAAHPAHLARPTPTPPGPTDLPPRDVPRLDPAPPEVGKRASVRVDADMYRALYLLFAAGMTLTDAIRAGLNVLSDTCEAAWDSGAYPEFTVPTVIGLTFPDPPTSPPSDTAPTADPQPSDTPRHRAST